MKKVIISISIILLLVLTLGCGCSKLEKAIKKEEVKVSTKEDVIKDQNIEVFTFTKTSLIYKENTSTFKTKVTNESENTENLKEIKIHIKNEKGEDIVVLPGYVGESINPSETKKITSSVGFDISNAYSIEYEIIR